MCTTPVCGPQVHEVQRCGADVHVRLTAWVHLAQVQQQVGGSGAQEGAQVGAVGGAHVVVGGVGATPLAGVRLQEQLRQAGEQRSWFLCC